MPRRNRSRMAASEWQAGPIVQMILARRPTEARLREAVSDGDCGFDSFNSFPIKAWILRLTGPIQTTSRPGRITIQMQISATSAQSSTEYGLKMPARAKARILTG